MYPRFQLEKPAQLGRVLLLPPAPAKGLPALRSDRVATRPTVVCHTKPGKPERGQCDAADVCAADRCDAEKLAARMARRGG